MQIRTVDGSGAPTSTVLASTTFPDDAPVGDSLLTAVFASPATVIAGQQYALVIWKSGELFGVGFREEDPCPGGVRWIGTGPTLDSGFNVVPDHDIVFRVFVTPLPPAIPSQAQGATCKGTLATLVGTPGNDLLIGTNGPDAIVALSGNDKVSGLQGEDLICGGDGKDSLKGGGDEDTLLGQKGADTLKGGGDDDTCKGGKGRDEEKSC